MYEFSVFKKLARNDTAQAIGHQGGIVIPKDLAQFFPKISGETSAENPTISIRLSVELFVDGRWVGRAKPRYQYQTWGGTRSPERRLTDQLKPLRDEASPDDVLIFRVPQESGEAFELHLVTQSSPDYTTVDELTKGKRWGVLDPKYKPVSESDIEEAKRYIVDEAEVSNSVYREKTDEVETRTKRIARDRAFREKVLNAYENRCAFTGRRFETPSGQFGIDAAHIVPVNRRGADRTVNGIALSKDVHWAFDHGLIGVGKDRRLIVPQKVAKMPGNEFLRDLAGKQIFEPDKKADRARDEAFEWHVKNVLEKD